MKSLYFVRIISWASLLIWGIRIIRSAASTLKEIGEIDRADIEDGRAKQPIPYK